MRWPWPVGAVSALVVGWVYDRVGAHVLLVVPVLVAAVPPLTLSDSTSIVVAGVVVWGLAAGVQDSAVKALVAELVPRTPTSHRLRRHRGHPGAFAVVGGVVIGWLYEVSLPALIATVEGVAAPRPRAALAYRPTGPPRDAASPTALRRRRDARVYAVGVDLGVRTFPLSVVGRSVIRDCHKLPT